MPRKTPFLNPWEGLSPEIAYIKGISPNHAKKNKAENLTGIVIKIPASIINTTSSIITP